VNIVRITGVVDAVNLDSSTRRFYTLDSFKREAWKLSREQPDLTHSQALEQLAKQRGFKTYAALRAAFKEAQP
jgi:hypothetical protein